MTCVIFSMNVFAQNIYIDNFETLNRWQKVVSDGASMNVSLVKGVIGNAIKIDYKFTGAGYCGIVKTVALDLPANYKFGFYLKANSPKNNLEFKLDDSTGDNVWWYVFRRYDFPKTWTEKSVRKRQIKFAWGPRGGGEIRKVHKIEIIISAAAGGSGTVYLDDLTFEPLPVPVVENVKPTVKTSSDRKGKPSFIFDSDPGTEWKSGESDKQSITINFNYMREYGGLIIHWDSLNYAVDYNVEASDNLKKWKRLYTAKNESRNLSFVPLGDNESKYLRINFFKSSSGKGYGIKEINIESYKFSEDDNYRFEKIAETYPEGYFPKYFLNRQTYWNVIGVSGDKKKALINTEGMIETEKEGFSVEPFLYLDNKFVTWNDVKLKQGLEEDYLPIPDVVWTKDNLSLKIKAFASGKPGSSSIYARYLIKNNSGRTQPGNLYLAVVPFQVNPPWQSLNISGGVAKINSIVYKNSKAFVNNDREIISVTKPSGFGASSFRNGMIMNYINKNSLPLSSSVIGGDGFASGAFKYSFRIKPGETFSAVIAIPFYKNIKIPHSGEDSISADLFYNKVLSSTIELWRKRLNKFEIKLPSYEDKLVNTLRSNLAYILVNKSGDALQPGTRCYDRSWIRDGAMMSESLLKMGIHRDVKDFINWFSRYQFPSGKIPCVVDQIGADPVPENDSQGEYIFLLKEYFNFTKDTAILKKHWHNIEATVNYIKYQISEESTPQYKNGTDEQKSFYGLVPKSISHEGYSAKPMHSYWDDFWVLKGLKDAVKIAEILGKKSKVNEYSKLRDEFRKNLYHSINLAMKNKNIDYIPGCAELGDFDPTSTTIAVSPCGELKNLPEPALQNTFNEYYKNIEKRLNPDDDWINFTPYEIRVAGTYIYLKEVKRAYKLLDFFFKYQRPEAWNEWAEVVWKDKEAPKFIGDMPHAWVGSAYINAVRALFVYEDENDSALIAGSGIKSEWLKTGEDISIKNMPTFYGPFSYSMSQNKNKVIINLGGKINSSCKKIIFYLPLLQKIRKVIADEVPSDNFKGSYVYLKPGVKKVILFLK